MNKNVLAAIVRTAIDHEIAGREKQAHEYVASSPLSPAVKSAMLSLLQAMRAKEEPTKAKREPLPRSSATLEKAPAAIEERKPKLSERIFGSSSDD